MLKGEKKIRVRDVQDVIELIGGRWRAGILASLCSQPKRFSELKKELGKITAAMLTKDLRFLEMNKMIVAEKKSLSENSVLYALSAHGRTLEPLIVQIHEWAKIHRAAVMTPEDQPIPPA